jgi:hypothetical protein
LRRRSSSDNDLKVGMGLSCAFNKKRWTYPAHCSDINETIVMYYSAVFITEYSLASAAAIYCIILECGYASISQIRFVTDRLQVDNPTYQQLRFAALWTDYAIAYQQQRVRAYGFI